MSTDPIPSEINELKKKLDENADSLVFAALADAYRKKGDLKEAFNICKKGLEKHPTYTSARVVLGRVFREQGKIDDAVSEFKKVLELDSENLMALNSLGSIFVGKKDYQAAIEEYQKALTLNPDDEEAQASLKDAIEKAAGDQKAPTASKKPAPGSEKSPSKKESTASLTIADLYLKQGHFDKAVEVYQELLAEDPQNLMLRQKMSEVVERQQKESAVDAGAAKFKKSEFTKPPDPKEDSIVEESKTDPKRPMKSKKEDDSKFTSEDILQVMRDGGKDDVVVDEKKSAPPKKEPTPAAPAAKNTEPDRSVPQTSLKPGQSEALKDIVNELGAVNGIMRCFVVGNDGITVVSVGETSNNAELGKQALAIFKSTHRSVEQLNQGKLSQVLVTAETGHILLVSFGNFVLIALANGKINLGLLRLALDAAMKKADKIL